MEVSGSGDNNITSSERQLMIEEQELQAPQGQLSCEVYSELLALYLLHNDLNNSKLLWKRIPEQCKTESPELTALWEVGRAFWKRDFYSVFQKCNEFTWSDIIQKIIDDIKENQKDKCINLISQAYTTISVESFALLLGCSNQECVELSVTKGWGLSEDQKIISPLKTQRPEGNPINNEAHLQKLTQYISFLET